MYVRYVYPGSPADEAGIEPDDHITAIGDSDIADDALWEKLHRHFSVPELVELGFFIGLTLGQQRWIKTLGIDHGAVLGDSTAGLAPVARAG